MKTPTAKKNPAKQPAPGQTESEERRLYKRMWYLENRRKILERRKREEGRNRSHHRPKLEVLPPTKQLKLESRSFVVHDGRVFFNSRLGYSLDEIELILQQAQKLLKK
jgi:hypothetical protein